MPRPLRALGDFFVGGYDGADTFRVVFDALGAVTIQKMNAHDSCTFSESWEVDITAITEISGYKTTNLSELNGLVEDYDFSYHIAVPNSSNVLLFDKNGILTNCITLNNSHAAEANIFAFSQPYVLRSNYMSNFIAIGQESKYHIVPTPSPVYTIFPNTMIIGFDKINAILSVYLLCVDGQSVETHSEISVVDCVIPSLVSDAILTVVHESQDLVLIWYDTEDGMIRQTPLGAEFPALCKCYWDRQRNGQSWKVFSIMMMCLEQKEIIVVVETNNKHEMIHVKEDEVNAFPVDFNNFVPLKKHFTFNSFDLRPVFKQFAKAETDKVYLSSGIINRSNLICTITNMARATVFGRQNLIFHRAGKVVLLDVVTKRVLYFSIPSDVKLSFQQRLSILQEAVIFKRTDVHVEADEQIAAVVNFFRLNVNSSISSSRVVANDPRCAMVGCINDEMCFLGCSKRGDIFDCEISTVSDEKKTTSYSYESQRKPTFKMLHIDSSHVITESLGRYTIYERQDSNMIIAAQRSPTFTYLYVPNPYNHCVEIRANRITRDLSLLNNGVVINENFETSFFVQFFSFHVVLLDKGFYFLDAESCFPLVVFSDFPGLESQVMTPLFWQCMFFDGYEFIIHRFDAEKRSLHRFIFGIEPAVVEMISYELIDLFSFFSTAQYIDISQNPEISALWDVTAPLDEAIKI
ncbi:hypothetical protein PCE1_001356 [Barthelona sp. PCE]